jgi:hypothetical protein
VSQAVISGALQVGYTPLNQIFTLLETSVHRHTNGCFGKYLYC